MMPRIRLALVVVLAVIGASACRETGDVQVSSIKFTGMQAVSAAELKAVIATQESGFLPWSRKRFFDRQAFDEDVKRLQAYYADRGYPDAKVVGVDVQFNDAKDKVAITVQISEGEPVLVSNVSFEGLDVIPADHLETLQARLPIKSGIARDQRLILASHEMVVGELRDHGFPYGSVRMLERPEAEPRRVQLAVAADPGPKSVFGAITIEGVASVDEDVIRRELGFAEGDLYQLSRIAETQRRLYGLELFQFVNVSPKLPEDRSPRVPVVVTVLEGKHRRLQLAAGYGSEEKGRARINWRHVNFGGGARTGETEAKYSSLEQGLRASFIEPFMFQRGLSMRITGSTWWADEPIYEYRSTGGRIVIAKDFSRVGFGAERGVRNRLSASLIHEYDDYAISDAALADPEFREELIALGLDPDTGRGKGTLSSFEVDFERSTAEQPLNPRQGYSVSAHVGHGRLASRRHIRLQRSSGRRAILSAARPPRRVGEPHPGGDAGRPQHCPDPVLQALFRRRIDERARLGAISGGAAELGGDAHRRTHDVRDVQRGAISGSRKAERSGLCRRRQCVARPMGRPVERPAVGRWTGHPLRHANRAGPARCRRATQSY